MSKSKSKSNRKIYPYNGELVQECIGCERQVFFFIDPRGNRIPVDSVLYTNHKFDCPKKYLFASSRRRKFGPHQGRHVIWKSDKRKRSTVSDVPKRLVELFR